MNGILNMPKNQSKTEVVAKTSTARKAVSYDKGRVTFPFSSQQFEDFLKSLLGRPEEFTAKFEGVFDFSADDIINIHHLVDQRIAQQNEATLIHFDSQIVFSDGTTVRLVGLDTIATYAETRSVKSEAVHLSWSYLVRFQDKSTPERQELTVSVLSSDNSEKEFNIFYKDSPLLFLIGEVFELKMTRRRLGVAKIKIKHTARSWGPEIGALMSNYFKGIFMENTHSLRAMERRTGWIALLVGMFVLVALLRVGMQLIISFNERYRQEVFDILALSPGEDPQALAQKLNYLIEYRELGEHKLQSDEYLQVSLLMTSSALLAIISATWVISAGSYRRPSFVLFSRESEKERSRADKSMERRRTSFVMAVVASLFGGIAANLIWLAFT